MVIDTLEILIEGDRSGLQSQLQRAAGDIQKFVSSMNRQEVSWTQILSKSITPALIAGIASTFAIAITQALQFQNAMQASSLGAADSFGKNSALMSDAVLGTSSDTGKSATDVAAALGIIQQAYKDTADAQQILNTVSEEASIRDIDAAKAAAILVPLFKQWGENAANTSIDMAVINASVKAGTINFDDLTSALTDSGIAMQKVGMSIPETATQLELISAKSGLTGDVVLQVFSSITRAIQDPTDKLNVLLGGIGKVSEDIKKGGLGLVFEDIATHIKNAGTVATALYGGVVGDSKAITELGMTTKNLATSTDGFQKLIDDNKDLNKQVQENMTATKELGKAWTNFVNALLGGPIPELEKALTNMLTGATSLVTMLNGGAKGKEETQAVITGGSQAFMESLHAKNPDMKDVANVLFQPFIVGMASFIDQLKSDFGGGGGSTAGVSNKSTYVNAPIHINSTPGGETVTGQKVGSYLKNQVHL